MRKVLFILFVLVVTGFALTQCNRPVSDAILIERWQKNRAAFDELLAITRKEVGNNGRDSKEKTELARKLGISIATGNEHIGFEFYAYSSGSVLGGVDKGFLYREQKPDAVEQNLDSIVGKKAWVEYLRPIEGNWYLFLLIDD